MSQRESAGSGTLPRLLSGEEDGDMRLWRTVCPELSGL